MNSYELSRAWFNYAFDNPEKIKPIHSAIYFFAIEHCNRLGWKEKFGFPSQMVMEAIGVKNWRTYSKGLNEIVEFGFINMIEISKNQYSSNIIAIVNNTKANTEATTKALDKALSKHSTKHSQGTVSIDKQYNNKTIEIYNPSPAEAEECVNHSFKNQSPPQEKEKEKSSAKKEKEIFDWDKLLEFINNNTGRSFKVINKAVRSKYKARLRDGYTKEDIISVIKNAPKTEFHKENNCQYCTPEYFSRAEIIDKYSEVTKNDSETTVAPKMNT